MKKFLLLVCVAPCLLSAQNATVKNMLKDRSFIQQVIRNLPVATPQQVVTRAGTESNLLDSVYIYDDKAKTELSEKIIFTYTSKDGKVTMEETRYEQYYSGWEAYNKIVYVLNESDRNNPIEIYSYDYENGDWMLFVQMKATSFDGAGRPTVYDVEFMFQIEEEGPETTTARMEVSYNTQGLMSSRSIFMATGDLGMPWFEVQIEEYTYDAAGYMIKSVFTYEGITSIEEYVNDEYGNPISAQVTIIEEGYGEWEYEEYYTNFYPAGNANEVIFSIQSFVYPNPASEVLYVTMEDVGEALVTLVNLSGSVVFQQKTNQPVPAIPVQSFAKGTYILTIQASAGTKSHKVVIR